MVIFYPGLLCAFFGLEGQYQVIPPNCYEFEGTNLLALCQTRDKENKPWHRSQKGEIPATTRGCLTTIQCKCKAFL